MERNRSETERRRRLTLRLLLGLPAAALAALALLCVVAGLLPLETPRCAGGQLRVSSVYVPMRDGTPLALWVILPEGLARGGRVPAVLETTRYSIMLEPTLPMRALAKLGLAKLDLGAGKPISPRSRLDYARSAAKVRAAAGAMEALLDAGYAYVVASSRGSGASFGSRTMEFSREELGDLPQLVEWIAAQPWSDGQVAVYGVSYSGNSAELAAAAASAALKAAAPLYADYDPIGANAIPGGVFFEHLVKLWSAANIAADEGKDGNLFFRSAAPLEVPGGRRLLKAAIAGHRTVDLAAALENYRFLDDELVPGYCASDIAPASFVEQLSASGVPLYVRVGWMDAGTVNGALERYLRTANAQELVIGPWSHGGFSVYDPFLNIAETREGLEAAQSAELTAFFGRAFSVKAPEGGAQGTALRGKTIRYYTYGAGSWRSTETWPPEGIQTRRLWFGPEGALTPAAPTERPAAQAGESAPAASGAAENGTDLYSVDFSASTGLHNRWRTNLGGGAVDYGDRAAEDRKLLVYDSAPLERDTELTGVASVSLAMEADVPDWAVFAYLEAVAPDGRVRYISEGMLRAGNRKTLADDTLREALGPRHSLLRSDASETEIGTTVRMEFALQATSVLIPTAWRIRIALAGQDASVFAPVAADTGVRFKVYRTAAKASWVDLPMRER